MLLPSSRIYFKAVQQNLMSFILLYLFCHCSFFFSIISSGSCVTLCTILIFLQKRGFHSHVAIFPSRCPVGNTCRFWVELKKRNSFFVKSSVFWKLHELVFCSRRCFSTLLSPLPLLLPLFPFFPPCLQPRDCFC